MMRNLTANTNRMTGRYLTVTLTLGAAILLSGCHVDMWRQPKMKPNYESTFFSDKQASRPLVEGTVAQETLQIADTYHTGKLADGKFVKTIPVEAVKSFSTPKAMLERGRERFTAYCTPCHGAVGNGNGMITQRGLQFWQKLPASYHTNRLRKVEDGYIYHTLVNGKGVMYGYASRIQDINDRWAIVSYVRALQLAQKGVPAADVTPEQLERPLESSRATFDPAEMEHHGGETHEEKPKAAGEPATEGVH